MILPLTYVSEEGRTLTIDLHRTLAIIPQTLHTTHDMTVVGLEFVLASGNIDQYLLRTGRCVKLVDGSVKRFLRHVWESAELEDDFDVIVDQWEANEAAQERAEIKKAERKKVGEIIEVS